jgi:hypothetical protein
MEGWIPVVWPLLVAVLVMLGIRRMLRRHAQAGGHGACRPRAANGPAARPGVRPGAGRARRKRPSGTAVPDGTHRLFKLAVPSLVTHFRQWGGWARSTEPVDDARLEAAVHALYAAAGLKPPRIVIVPSPLAMMLAHGLASALVWTRDRQGPLPLLGDAAAVEKEASLAAGGFLSNPASEAIEGLRSAALGPARGRWELAQRVLRRQLDRLEQRGTLHLEGHAAAAVREHLRELTGGDPAAQARWETESLPAYAAAAEAAVQASGVNRPSWAATTSTLNGLLGWADCCIFTGDGMLRACFEASLVAATQRARWAPLQTRVPMIGAARYLLEQPRDEFKRFEAWEACAREAGDLLAHPEFCIVSERPEFIHLDEQGLLHCADGPSVRWRDGWCLYHWHGVRIPTAREDVITDPGRITVERIDNELNEDVRRVMIDRFGAARYVMEGHATVVHTLPPDHPLTGLRGARLLRKEGGRGGEPVVFVELVDSTPGPDGTHRRYSMRVDPQAYGGRAARECHAAAASTWRCADGSLAYPRYTDYRPAAES